MALNDKSTTGTFDSGLLIADRVQGESQFKSQSGGKYLSCSLEFQSTTSVPMLPRLSGTQITDLDNTETVTDDGMLAYNSSVPDVQFKINGRWEDATPIRKASITLTAADVDSLFDTFPTILPELTNGNGYVVMTATAFLTPSLAHFVSDDSVIDIFFDGPGGESALASTFENSFVTSAGGGRVTVIGKNGNGTAIAADQTNGKALKIRSTGVDPFTSGGAATITITVLYSIISD